ncbi:MAG TPA: nucleotide-binding protein [Longimicrobium sp.]
MKYSGSVQDLRQAIAGSGTRVEVEERDNLYVLRTATGAICTWTPTTGRLVFQGKPAARDKIEEVVSKFLERRLKRQVPSTSSSVVPTKRKPKSKKIFVVHGHDLVAREQLELVLHELKLEPFVLARSSGGGLTIIEALEKQIVSGDDAAGFGIVLLTPDDMGHARKAGGNGTRPRARQNVILELGMLIGALGRHNVAVVKTGDIELPSDISLGYSRNSKHLLFDFDLCMERVIQGWEGLLGAQSPFPHGCPGGSAASRIPTR